MTPKPQAKTLDEIMDNSHIPLFMRLEVEANIQALITKARIEELEKCLGFGEKYWAVNAHKHFNHRLTQLKKERANE